MLIRHGFGVTGEVPAAELSLARLEDWWTAAHGYAVGNKHETGYPIFLSLTRDGKLIYLFFYLDKSACTMEVVPIGDLKNSMDILTRLPASADIAGVRHIPGAIPAFDDHNYGRGMHYGSILFKPGSADFRDIPVTELDPVVTPDDRMRAVNKWASGHGYVAGFPTYHVGTQNGVRVYGAVLLKGNVAEWRDVYAGEFGNFPGFEDRMRKTNDWAFARGYVSGFSNMFSADYGPVAGTFLIERRAGVFLDAPAAVLGPLATMEDRFRAVNTYAVITLQQRGFIGAFPTFMEGPSGVGLVALQRGPVEFRDVPAADMGNPVAFGDRMRAAAKWASDHGFVGGFPTFMEAVYNGVKVQGLVLLKSEAAEWRDVRIMDLGWPESELEQFQRSQLYAISHGFVGACPNFFQADYGPVNGTVLIKPNAGAEWKDLTASALMFG